MCSTLCADAGATPKHCSKEGFEQSFAIHGNVFLGVTSRWCQHHADTRALKAWTTAGKPALCAPLAHVEVD